MPRCAYAYLLIGSRKYIRALPRHFGGRRFGCVCNPHSIFSSREQSNALSKSYLNKIFSDYHH